MATSAKPFTLGEDIHHDELKQAVQRIYGRTIGTGDASAVARHLAATRGPRLEFEINRIRGWAFDQDELA